MLNSIYQSLNPVAFSVFSFDIRWYGLAYLLGFLLGGFIMHRTIKRWKLRISLDDLLTAIICVVIGILIGGRLGYCLFYGDGYYFSHPLEIIHINQGGMSFHGALAGAFLAGIIAVRMVKVPFLTLSDLAFIAAPVGLFFGRCANFVNGELWGAPTDLPIGVVFGGAAGEVARHPSQLYEALLEGLVIFAILFLLSRKKPPYPRGVYTGTFMLLYGIFRIAVEFVREPDAQLGYLFGGWLTMGMILSVPVVIAGVGVLVYALITKNPQIGVESSLQNL